MSLDRNGSVTSNPRCDTVEAAYSAFRGTAINIVWTLTTFACLGVVVVTAEPIPQPAPAKRSVPAAADDASVKAVAAHFAKNEVKLQHDEDARWVVTNPKGDGYKVVVYMRTFPAGATEKEMQDDLKTINLAFMLHAPSRVAMSYPGLQGTDAGKKLPKLDQIPVVAKLEKLFKEYQPPEPKK